MNKSRRSCLLGSPKMVLASLLTKCPQEECKYKVFLSLKKLLEIRITLTLIEEKEEGDDDQ